MPFYEYECSKCGYQTEILQKITDPPITKCELCNGRMKRLISQSTFHLKGSGWYVTDYASKTGGYDGKSSGSADKRSSTETKSETSTSETKEASAIKKEAKSKD